jgi:hypothetical protein
MPAPPPVPALLHEGITLVQRKNRALAGKKKKNWGDNALGIVYRAAKNLGISICFGCKKSSLGR